MQFIHSYLICWFFPTIKIQPFVWFDGRCCLWKGHAASNNYTSKWIMVGCWMASLRRPVEAKADQHQWDPGQPRHQRRLRLSRQGPGEAGPRERDECGRAGSERQVPPPATGVWQRDGERGQREQRERRRGRGREQRAPGAVQSSRCGTEAECHEVLTASVASVIAVVLYSLSPPPNVAAGVCNKMKWLLMWPLSLLLFFTVPNCGKRRWERWFLVSFFTATIWIAGLSYIMVWMVSGLRHHCSTNTETD